MQTRLFPIFAVVLACVSAVLLCMPGEACAKMPPATPDHADESVTVVEEIGGREYEITLTIRRPAIPGAPLEGWAQPRGTEVVVVMRALDDGPIEAVAQDIRLVRVRPPTRVLRSDFEPVAQPLMNEMTFSAWNSAEPRPGTRFRASVRFDDGNGGHKWVRFGIVAVEAPVVLP